MIEISFWKILIVLLVALIVLGPDQLPKIAHSFGRLISQLRGLLHNVQKDLHSLTWDEKKEARIEDKKEN